MRIMLNQVNIDGTIVIGEGEIDEAPMLYIGEKVGTGHGDAVDIAVDPIEGTRMTAMGQANVIHHRISRRKTVVTHINLDDIVIVYQIASQYAKIVEAAKQAMDEDNGRIIVLVLCSLPMLDELWPHSESYIFAKAAHAPFISHPDEFCQQLVALKQRV